MSVDHFLQFANSAPRTEVARIAAHRLKQADCGKIVIAVSEDIDPEILTPYCSQTSLQSVEDVHIEPYPIAVTHKSGSQAMDSTMLIDATLKHSMPPLALPAARTHRARTSWKELGLPPISPSSVARNSLAIGATPGIFRPCRGGRLGEERCGYCDAAARRRPSETPVGMGTWKIPQH
jgi:hypothetical protein